MPHTVGHSQVRCRFAPSPTGYLHLGGARTALFNYLFARSHGGVHILRIEDTDQLRSTKEALDAITEGLKWLNIPYDEGPFFQSERNSLYYDYARTLLRTGHAYRCYCTPAELDKMREEQRALGIKPQYDRRWRPAELAAQPTDIPNPADEKPFAIRLRAPLDGETIFDDLVLGEICTDNKELDDFIIVRSDGYPTYNFAVVVDDIDMRISHVIRGMDHVSNTPKQILIYQALGAPLPSFAHVPMILGPDKKKLSKRHGATAVTEYAQDGYLSDAFVNYLARLGWSHGDQEIFTRAELEKHFSLEHVNKSPAVFDWEKLHWVNHEHIKRLPTAELAAHSLAFLNATAQQKAGLLDDQHFLKLIESLKERVRTLRELGDNCQWYFIDGPPKYDDKSCEQHLTKSIETPLNELVSALEHLPEFSEEAIETAFKGIIEKHGLKLVKLAQPVRVAMTGGTVSPPIFTVLEVLGRDRVLQRLRAALARLK